MVLRDNLLHDAFRVVLCFSRVNGDRFAQTNCMLQLSSEHILLHRVLRERIVIVQSARTQVRSCLRRPGIRICSPDLSQTDTARMLHGLQSEKQS